MRVTQFTDQMSGAARKYGTATAGMRRASAQVGAHARLRRPPSWPSLAATGYLRPARRRPLHCWPRRKSVVRGSRPRPRPGSCRCARMRESSDAASLTPPQFGRRVEAKEIVPQSALGGKWTCRTSVGTGASAVVPSGKAARVQAACTAATLKRLLASVNKAKRRAAPSVSHIQKPAGSEGTSGQSGQPTQGAGPISPAEAVVMTVTLSVPQDRYKELISILPEFAQVIESRIFQGGVSDRPVS